MIRPLNLLGLLAVAAATGCATLAPTQGDVQPPSDVTAEREARRERTVAQYEASPHAALYKAAAARWHTGDGKSALQALEQLVARSPDHRQARLMLADIHLTGGHPERARVEIERLLAVDPRDPSALRAMGLLLELTGQVDETAAWYARADEAAAESTGSAAGSDGS